MTALHRPMPRIRLGEPSDWERIDIRSAASYEHRAASKRAVFGLILKIAHRSHLIAHRSWPALTKFTNSLIAPGTPAGN